MAETCDYIGGLAKGKPNDEVKVDVKGGALRVEKGGIFGSWDVCILVTDIRAITIDTAEHATFKRVIATGLFAGMWKKKEYYLGVDYEMAGLTSTAVFHAKQDVLNKVQQSILNERSRLAAAAQKAEQEALKQAKRLADQQAKQAAQHAKQEADRQRAQAEMDRRAMAAAPVQASQTPISSSAAAPANIAPPQAPVQADPSEPQSSLFQQLEGLAQLHEKGILTDDEFAAKKAEILARI